MIEPATELGSTRVHCEFPVWYVWKKEVILVSDPLSLGYRVPLFRILSGLRMHRQGTTGHLVAYLNFDLLVKVRSLSKFFFQRMESGNDNNASRPSDMKRNRWENGELLKWAIRF